jgi:hypothetical protein
MINKYKILIILLLVLFSTGLYADDDSLIVDNGLSFDTIYHNFSTVTMGDKLMVSFKFKNTSKKLITITKVTTKCGCTVAKLNKLDYAPGEQGQVDVSLDTTFKQGWITKTITLNTDNKDQEVIEMSLAANVVLPPHPLEKSIDILKDKQCRLCHIDAAKGEEDGGYIYHKICWQCHGNNVKPPIKNSINLFNLNYLKARTDEQLYHSIAFGAVANGMPAYLDEKELDGLSVKQIKSIVQFLRSKEKQ